ncbi:hypothetical protein C9374_011286 [Naegleria lovaniensis]|uniref:Methyltransferase FkbM domain-containing protein n=1 Tax=Naegleria lovaniensis TaxID=51637 RepID=A0AA88H470_NAELO|nr:uncharacterized protein C9374_011286 [Naegleria lovaniensis]KAG2392561.1 hypothetical protein C9374_011286 [Naegleria lovaniensis]
MTFSLKDVYKYLAMNSILGGRNLLYGIIGCFMVSISVWFLLLSSGKTSTQNHRNHHVPFNVEPRNPIYEMASQLPFPIIFPVKTKTSPPLSVACYANDQIICKFLREKGRWDVFDHQEKILAHYFNNNNNNNNNRKQRYFMDFGSNLGLFALLLAAQSSDWKGIAVEALFSSIIEFNVYANRLEKQIKVVSGALAENGVGKVKMKLVADNPGGSLVTDQGNVEVQRMTIDDIVEKYEHEGFIPKGVEFDYVKMDVEGWEVKALRGATKLLQQKRVKIWHLEYSIYIKNGGDEPKELHRMMVNAGYTVYLDPERTKLITLDNYEVTSLVDVFAFRNDLLTSTNL